MEYGCVIRGKILMPLYTVKDNETEEEWDINCSYDELQELLDISDGKLTRILSTPNFVSSTQTHANAKTSDGWKDLLGRVKKGAGRRNTIKT